MCQVKVGRVSQAEERDRSIGGHWKYFGVAGADTPGMFSAGLSSDFPRTARLCWDLIASWTFLVKLFQGCLFRYWEGKEKGNWVIRMSQG